MATAAGCQPLVMAQRQRLVWPRAAALQPTRQQSCTRDVLHNHGWVLQPLVPKVQSSITGWRQSLTRLIPLTTRIVLQATSCRRRATRRTSMAKAALAADAGGSALPSAALPGWLSRARKSFKLTAYIFLWCVDDITMGCGDATTTRCWTQVCF